MSKARQRKALADLTVAAEHLHSALRIQRAEAETALTALAVGRVNTYALQRYPQDTAGEITNYARQIEHYRLSALLAGCSEADLTRALCVRDVTLS